MDDNLESFIRKKAKCLEAIKGIHLLMAKNGIRLPGRNQKSRVHEDLPFDPKAREAEILRRFNYLEPENREQMEEKLNDLLVYAEVAKALRSELIAIIVLSKLRKWEDLLLQPNLAMPHIPSPSPEQKRLLLERKKNVEERDQRTANVLREYERHGDDRRAAVQSFNPFDVPVRTTTLPPQFIGPPQGDTASRVDLNEQRRRDIDAYQKFGAIRKRLHDDPEFQRDLKGPKLPDHGLPVASQQGDSQSMYKALAHQKKMDGLRQQLKTTLSLINQNLNNQPDRREYTPYEQERELEARKQNIENRDQRVAATLKKYVELGQSRRDAVQSMNQFDERVRTITLPPLTIGLPQPQMQGTTTARVDLEAQRRRDIEDFEKLGAARKRLHDLPEFQRELKGPKLPDHKLPSTSNVGAPSKYPDLEKQRSIDRMRRQLYEAFTPRKGKRPIDNKANTGEARNMQSKESVAERSKIIANTIKEFEERGKRRRAEVQSINPFQDNVRTVRLPEQTIPSTTSGAPATRVDIDEQTRRDIEEYQKFGAIRKRQHDIAEYQRDAPGPKLRTHCIPLTAKLKEVSETRSKYKQLEKQRELDKLRNDLQGAIQARKRIRRHSPENVRERRTCDNNPESDSANSPNDPDTAPDNLGNDQ